jgi:hypothetical protein
MALKKEGLAAGHLAVLANRRIYEYNYEKTSFFYFSEWDEASGFQTENDLASGYLTSPMVLPERILQADELIQKRRGLRVSDFKSRKDLRTLIPCLQSSYNKSLGGTTGNVPLTDEEVKTLAEMYKRVQNTGYIYADLVQIGVEDDRIRREL